MYFVDSTKKITMSREISELSNLIDALFEF